MLGRVWFRLERKKGEERQRERGLDGSVGWGGFGPERVRESEEMKSVWCEAEKVRESKEMRSVGWVWTGESEGDEVVWWGGVGYRE